MCSPSEKPPLQPPNHCHLLLQISGTHCQIICHPFRLFLLLEELSNITCSCLLTLTVVRNLVRSNQLNLSRFVIHRQLLSSHSPETPCRPSEGVPSERLRLVKWFISHRLHTGACVNLVLLTYLLGASMQTYRNDEVHQCRRTELTRCINADVQNWRGASMQTYRNDEVHQCRRTELTRCINADVQNWRGASMQTYRIDEVHQCRRTELTRCITVEMQYWLWCIYAAVPYWLIALLQMWIETFILHYITLHYRHFKRHLHLKWPVVHQQLHVIRNTAHRPSTQASYTASRVRPKRKISCAAAQIAATQIAATLTISFPRWRHMSLTSYWGQQRMSLTSYPGHILSHNIINKWIKSINIDWM